MGRLIALDGHSLVTTDAPGTNHTVLAGFKAHSDQFVLIPKDVLNQCDFCIVFPDERLLNRLADAGYDIHNKDQFMILYALENIHTFCEAALAHLDSKKIDIEIGEPTT